MMIEQTQERSQFYFVGLNKQLADQIRVNMELKLKCDQLESQLKAQIEQTKHMKSLNRELLQQLQISQEETSINSIYEDPNRLHVFYKDLYLTDLKNDLSEVSKTLVQEQKNKSQQDALVKQQGIQIKQLKRVIQTYRKQVVELERVKSQERKSVGNVSQESQQEMQFFNAENDDEFYPQGGDLAEQKFTRRKHKKNFIELDRLEKLTQFLKQISFVSTFDSIADIVFNQLPELLNCSSVQIFLISTQGINLDRISTTVNFQKTVLEGRYIDALYKQGEYIEAPQFKRRYECNVLLRQPNFMSVPVWAADKMLHHVIQCISKKKDSLNIGFTLAEEVILSLIGAIIQIKLKQLLTTKESQSIKKNDLNLISIAGLISTQRSYSDIIFIVKEDLPRYFEFQGVAILLRDTITNELFSLELDLTPQEQAFYDYIRNKKAKGLQLTQDERLKDFERQLRQGTKHIYPNSLGVTGEVYHSRQVVYSSNMKKVKSFIPNLDNQCKEIKDVQSFMIAPAFGHANEDGSPYLVAILQFINKIDGQITEYDVQKIEKMSMLIGKSVQNASEHHAVINVKVGVSDRIEKLQNTLQRQEQNNIEQAQSLNNVAVPIKNSIQCIKEMQEEQQRKQKLKKSLNL